MVMTDESYEALCQTDESDTECTMVDDAFDGSSGFSLSAPTQRYFISNGNCLAIAVFWNWKRSSSCLAVMSRMLSSLAKNMSMRCCLFSMPMHSMASFTILMVEKQKLPRAMLVFSAPTVFEYTCAAPHGRDFPLVTLRIVGTPLLVLVEGSVEVEEVREETTGSYLAGQLVEVVVAIFLQIVYATLFLPDLDGKMAVSPLPTPS